MMFLLHHGHICLPLDFFSWLWRQQYFIHLIIPLLRKILHIFEDRGKLIVFLDYVFLKATRNQFFQIPPVKGVLSSYINRDERLSISKWKLVEWDWDEPERGDPRQEAGATWHLLVIGVSLCGPGLMMKLKKKILRRQISTEKNLPIFKCWQLIFFNV